MDVNDINKKHKSNFYHDYFIGTKIRHLRFLIEFYIFKINKIIGNKLREKDDQFKT